MSSRVNPPDAIERARQSHGSLLLIGPSGSGKTTLAAALVRRAVDAASLAIHSGDMAAYRYGAGARFMQAYELAKAGIYSPLGKRPKLVDEALNATLLVIDDLGMDVEVFSQSATSVREVIHERHAEQRDTVVTTYFCREHIIHHYGEGIARRLGKATMALGTRQNK